MTNAQERVEYPARQIRLSTHAQNKKQIEGTMIELIATLALKITPDELALRIETTINTADIAK